MPELKALVELVERKDPKDLKGMPELKAQVELVDHKE
jgi:hypothetical protein